MKKVISFICAIAAGFVLVACAPERGESEGGGDVTVTFSAGEGAFIATGATVYSVKADKNGKVDAPSESMRDGYAFDGWYNGQTKYEADVKHTSDVTYTARYVSGAGDAVFDALFDEDATVSIFIDMPDEEWIKLDADVDAYRKSPIYRKSDYVTVRILNDGVDRTYYFEEVGIRLKGNTSRHKFYSNHAFYDAVHFKLSFKETFDDLEDGYKSDELVDWSSDAAGRAFRKARTFGGMEKIDIKYNSTGDETYVRELYAMKAFRENGVLAPHSTLASVVATEGRTSSARNLGVYRINEPIDEQFIIRSAGDGSEAGDLYKCTWGNSPVGANMSADNMTAYIGVEDELKNEFYAYDKKTNKKKDKVTGLRDFSSMTDFLAAANGSDPDFDGLIDIDAFTEFEAINYILGNPDCIRNNANNYYVYFRKSDGKAIVIPYDYDRCLGLTHQWDPSGNGMTETTPYTRWTFVNNGSSIVNPLYSKLIVKGASTGAGSALLKYRSKLLAAKENPLFSASSFEAYKNKYKDRYKSFTVGAVNGNALAFDINTYDNISFADYISRKMQTLDSNIDNYYA